MGGIIMPSDDDNVQSLVQEFHGEVQEREYCLGDDCPKKNCEICSAADRAKFKLDVTDEYRQKVKTGYYTTTCVEVVDKITGQRKYVYTRPG